MTDTERLIELEVRLTYLEDTLATLDQVITGQAEQIDRLQQINNSLVEMIQSLQERLDSRVPGAMEPPPPHY